MGKPQPGKDTSALSAFTGQEAEVDGWATTYPAMYRLYWQMRAALADSSGRNEKHHHHVALFGIHDCLGGAAERKRLGLPPTDRKLAQLLGISDRTLRRYRHNYDTVLATTRQMMRETFIGEYYGRVLEALGNSATVPAPAHSPDRRLFLQLAGDLVEKADVTSGGQPLPRPEYARLSDEELLERLAELDQKRAGAVPGAD